MSTSLYNHVDIAPVQINISIELSDTEPYRNQELHPLSKFKGVAVGTLWAAVIMNRLTEPVVDRLGHSMEIIDTVLRTMTQWRDRTCKTNRFHI